MDSSDSQSHVGKRFSENSIQARERYLRALAETGLREYFDTGNGNLDLRGAEEGARCLAIGGSVPVRFGYDTVGRSLRGVECDTHDESVWEWNSDGTRQWKSLGLGDK